VKKIVEPVIHTRFLLKVRLLEDLHTGSGMGSGPIDALLARDARGRPVIRWSHLKGVLLQAMFDRAEALEEPEAERLGAAHRIFGKENRLGEGRGTLRGSSLRTTGSTKASMDAFVVGSTGREPMSRAPMEDSLRQVEYLRRGTELACELRLPGSADSPDAVLLKKLLRRAIKLGAKRSRGDGRVQLQVETKALTWPAPTSRSAPAVGSAPDKSLDQWTTCKLVLRTLEPVCLGASGQPGNLIPTHSHLSPGTVVGVLARWALEARWDDLADALLQGHVVCGAAYPCPIPEKDAKADEVWADAVPMPLAYMAPKPAGQPGEWPWWAEAASQAPENLPEDTLRSASKIKLKRPSPHDYLATVDGTNWQRFTCPTRVAMHNDAGHSQRTESETQLRAVEEVPEGTAFVLHLAVRHAVKPLLHRALQAMLQDRHWLPVRRGGAPTVIESLVWTDSAAKHTPANSNVASVRLFVETDLLLRTASLAFHTRLETAAVADLLNEAGADPDVVASLCGVDGVSEPVVLHGWNIATGAPRLPAIAIRRGSMAMLRFRSTAAADQAREQLGQGGQRGLGERAGEGHGRVRVDFAPAPTHPTVQQPSDLRASESEQVFVDVQRWMERDGLVALFSAKRWHGLHDAAATSASRLIDWFVRSKLVAKRGKAPAEQTKVETWLSELERDANGRPALLVVLGLRAAKQAKYRDRSNRTPESEE